MAKPYDTRLIMMVAQQPFEADMNRFCKLIPIVYVDGVRPTSAEFPNDGEVWWMLTAKSGPLAVPGLLVVGLIEDAVRYDESDPTASQFQLKRDSAQGLDPADGLPVLDVPGDAIDSIHEVVSGGFGLECKVTPALVVLLRWRSQVFGPFNVSQDTSSDGSPHQRLMFTPADAAHKSVYCIEESTFDDATSGRRVQTVDDVSMTTHRRAENFELAQVTNDIVLAAGYEQALAKNPERVVLEPLDRKLLRYAKQCMTRSKRQQLRSLLRELEITGREIEEAEDLTEAINRITRLTAKQDAALDVVTEALLETHVLGEERIQKAEQEFGHRYVAEKTAELQATVEQSVLAKREELREVETSLKDVQGRLQAEEAQRRTQLDNELTAKRESLRQEMVAERKAFDQQRAELERLEAVLKGNLARVTKELREAGDEVVNRFLTLAPLLKTLGFADRENPTRAASPDTRERADPKSAVFVLPDFIESRPRGTDQKLSEEAFFARFQQVVEGSGFCYRLLDLQRFHVSVKCCDVTVLGGPSGTGKSSLPGLYAMALIGEEGDHGRPGCLMVNINPSWMDVRDLLGHLNTLEGRYYPAESGLFQHLIYAQQEYANREHATGIHMVCLDEMNLSQVEHYFSEFMMVLERTGDDRAIQCFAPEVVGATCPFRHWDRVSLSHALRFVGTVNFDETTRVLSDRFLDRVNLIHLTSLALPSVTGTPGGFARVPGRMVTLADFALWRKDKALPSDLGSLLDKMRPLLARIGCPISPRVYRGICRFVASAPPLMTEARAFDVQMAQRVVPKIRSLVTSRQMDAVDEFLTLVRQSSVCPFDESTPLLEEVAESAGVGGWGSEE